MSKIRNTGILSLYLAKLVSAQHKNKKTFAKNTLYGHIKKPKKITDFFMILDLGMSL